MTAGPARQRTSCVLLAMVPSDIGAAKCKIWLLRFQDERNLLRTDCARNVVKSRAECGITAPPVWVVNLLAARLLQSTVSRYKNSCSEQNSLKTPTVKHSAKPEV